MLEHKMFLGVRLQHDGVFIERADVAGNLCAIQQMDSEVLAARKRAAQKRFLNIDRRHDSDWPSFLPERQRPLPVQRKGI